MQAAHDRAVIESTSLIDVATMELIPNSITELGTDSEGNFPDFLLSNGHMALLHPEEGDFYDLKKGDVVELSVDSQEECYLVFSIFLDGKFIQEQNLWDQNHKFTYEAKEDGRYNFSIIYGSAAADSFTNGHMSIQ